MINILITGKGSYIGTYFRDYLLKYYPDDFHVDELDMIGDNWKNYDFSNYDSVYHVAGLAHSTPDESQRELYYSVNTNLAYETAKKAKEAGVKQFVFMSSIIVYGSGEIGKPRVIKEDTPLTPDNFYGDSKKQAEIKISELEDKNFKICIVRPPMIYGPGSKGNYPLLSNFAKKTPIFPTIENQRSMLYIGNLVEFIRLMIKNNESGIFLPQNEEYVSSRLLIKTIAKESKHKVFFIPVLNPIIRILKNNVYINKVFGNLTIEKRLSEYKENYNVFSFNESIKITEKKR